MPNFVIEADAALAGHLRTLIANAFPGVELRVEEPVRESVGPEEVITVTQTASAVVITVSTLVPPTLDALRAIIAYVKEVARRPKVRQTVLRFVAKDQAQGEIRIDLTTSDEKVAIEAFRQIFGKLQGNVSFGGRE